MLTRMAEATNGWNHRGIANGISSFSLQSWSAFFDFLEAMVFDLKSTTDRSYIWRGQRRSDWSLVTTLDRQLDTLGLLSAEPDELERISSEHLKTFRYAARGRRGSNPAALSDYEWWALGQHFGLATPLLDWTRSPFAALYFAFEEPSSETNTTRAIYGLSAKAVRHIASNLENGPSFERGRLATIEVVDPMSDENQRLVSQGGCFTRAPIGKPVETWVEQAFEDSDEPVMLRIEIANSDRLGCLRALNRMNINHLSLFPDLTGASRFTNLLLETESR